MLTLQLNSCSRSYHSISSVNGNLFKIKTRLPFCSRNKFEASLGVPNKIVRHFNCILAKKTTLELVNKT